MKKTTFEKFAELGVNDRVLLDKAYECIVTGTNVDGNKTVRITSLKDGNMTHGVLIANVNEDLTHFKHTVSLLDIERGQITNFA